jgi:PAS domain S-box-containing protein
MNLKPTYEELEKRIHELEEALLERDRILDELPDHLIIQDLNHRILWANKAACKSQKLEKSEILGRSCHELWGQSSMPCSDCPLPESVEEDRRISLEKRTPDGKEWRIRCSPLPSSNHETRSILQITEDITEAVKSRETRHQAEKHRELILDTMQEMLAYYDTNLRVQWANRSAAQSIGQDMNDLRGRYCYEIWQARDVPCEECPVLEAIKTGHPQETEVSTPDDRHFHIRGYPVHDEQGKVIGALEYGFDMTKTAKAEIALRNEKERYRKLVETAPYGIQLTDLSGKIIFSNPAHHKIQGYADGELIGRHIWDLMADKKHRESTKAYYEKLITSQHQPETYYNRDRTKDGREIDVQINWDYFYDSDGHLDGIISIVSDVTEIKRAEENLKANEALMRYIIKHDPNALAVYDHDLCYIAVSDRYLKDYNVKEHDILGRHHYEVFPEMPQHWKDVHQRVINGAIEKNDDDYFERPDGSITYNRWECRPWYHADGSIGGMITYTEVTTERKKAELAVKEALLRQQEAVKAGNVGLWDWDLKDDTVWYSPEWKRQIGYEDDEIGTSFDEWERRVHPDDLPRTIGQVKQVIQDRLGAYKVEFRFMHKDGSYRNILAQASVLTDENGEPMRTLGSHVDITDRKKAEKALKESEERFRSFMKYFPGPTFIKNNEKQLLYCNEKFAQLLNTTPDEIIGLNIDDNVSPELEKVYEQENKAVIKDGKVLESESVFSYGGKDIHWLTYKFPIKIETERLLGAISIDISDRKKVEEALKESETRFREMAGNIKDVFWLFDWKTKKIIYASPAYEKIWGRSVESLVENYDEWESSIHPDDRLHVEESFQQLIENNGGEERFYRIIRPDGNVRWIGDSGFVIRDEAGKIIRITGVARDITDRKQLDEKLEFERKQYLSIFDSIDEIIYITDPYTYEILYVNQAIKKAFNKELVGGICYKEFQGLDSPCHFCTNEIILKQKPHAYRWEYHNPVINRDLAIVDRIIKWPDGRDVRFELAIDITERKLAEKALSASEERLKLALDSVTDAVWDWQVDTGEVYYSSRWYTMLGYEPYELPQDFETWRSLLHPDDLPGSEAKVFRHLESAEPFESEFRMRTKDNQWRWIYGRGKTVERNDQGKAVRMLGTHVDISERKKAEDALRRSETLFKTMLTAIPDMISIHDTDMNVVYSNWNGFAAVPQDNRILGDKCYRIYRGHDKVCPDCRAKEVIDTRKPFAEEVELIEGGWVELNALPILDADGNCELFVEWVRDITERKESEKELQKSEEKFRALVDNTIDWVWQTDANSKYTYVSENTYEILGYTSEELLGRTPFDLMDNEEAGRVLSIFQEIAQKHDRIVALEDTLQHKDGHSVIFETNATPLIDNNTNLQGYFGTCRDISERKQAQKDLIRQKRSLDLHNRIASVFLTSPGESVYADVLDVILELMDSRFGYFGYVDEAGDLICPSMTRDVWDQCQVAEKSIVFPRSGWSGLWGRSLMEKRTLVANENLQAPEGHVALENALATPIMHHNTLIGQFVVANKAGGYDKEDRDLLEAAAVHTAPILFAIQEEARQKEAHEKLEVRLRQAQKMEAIGTLAGGIAHDFNNILFPIVGMSEMLLEDIPTGTPEHGNVQEIFTAGKRGSELVKQILAFSRQSEDQKIPVRIQQVLKEVVKMVRATIPTNINITHHIKPDCGLVMADPTQVHQIAMNLITNAYHAVDPDNGNISVQLKEVVLASETLVGMDIEAGPYALLTVSDSGCGIAPANMEKIFDPYFTTKEQGKGTGIGLSTVYGIVKEHGGDVQVYSELGKGTTFNIYLPLIEKTPDFISENTSESSPSGTERILLVDDEDAIVRIEKQILERLGYRITSRVSSLEALEAFKASPESYDLVITDMSMPNMTGDRLAREVIAIQPDVPVIVCTGFSEKISHEKAEAFGIKGILMKPIVKSEMAQMVRKVLDEAKNTVTFKPSKNILD